MKAFEITLKVDTGPYQILEFTGRFCIDYENYVRGVVTDNSGEQSYLYGHCEQNHFVCVNIKNIERNPKQFYFNFHDVTCPGFCYFTANDFTSNKRKDLRRVSVYAFVKEITENSDAIAKDVESIFIKEMQRHASAELLTSLYLTVEKAKAIFF